MTRPTSPKIELSEDKRALLELLLQEEGLNNPSVQSIPRRQDDGPVPLSFAQQRLWFLDQFEPGTSTYNIPGAVRLKGPLNIVALEQSLLEILRRHESLRTTFVTEAGQPFQVINPDQTLSLDVIDLTELPKQKRETEADRLVNEEARKPFDISRDLLLRALLLRLDKTDHIFMVTMHHIASDGWSFNIFARELAVLYTAYIKGEPSPLPELPIQYADYALWQQDWLQNEVLEEQLSYWKQQLGGELPILELPLDYPRPPVQTFREASLIRLLSVELSQALRNLSQQGEATLFMTLLAVFNLLMHRYTGQEDIIVGSPIAGRNWAEVEGLIGFFLNTLILRADLSGNPSFRDLLEQVREVCSSAYANQDVPFEKLLEELQPVRDLSRRSLFQVLFNMLPISDKLIELPDLAGEVLSRPSTGSKFDLTLYVNEVEHCIRLRLVYNADLFAPERMAEMLAQYSHLLEQIVADPDQKIDRFSLVTDTARAVLPGPTEAIQATWLGAAHTTFADQASRTPQSIALVDGWGEWSYQALDELSNQLAHFLLKQGLQREGVVTIYAHRSAALVWAMLGILKAGGAFLILDPAYPAERLVKYVEIASPQAWLQAEAAGQLPDELESFVSTLPANCRLTLPQTGVEADSLLADYAITDPQLKIEPDDLAYIAFTSGSTGEPKGILGSHQPLAHFVQWHSQRFGLTETDRFSMLGGLAHDPLLRDIFTPLCLGATLCIPSQEDILMPGQLIAWMSEKNISVCHLTPAVSQLLTQTAVERTQNNGQPVTLNSLRYAFFGGDVLTNQHVQVLKELAPAVECVNFYGTTETPQAMAYLTVASSEQNGDGNSREITEYKIPIGQGIEGVQLLVLNQAQQLAGIGEVGEICVRTPYLARGYLGDEALTQERFITNPFTKIASDRIYRTGDLGRYLSDGKVEHLGRNDNQVKIRGFRIELGEIEAVLRQYPGIRETVVSTWTTEIGDKQLAAYVVPTTPSLPPTASVLREFLQEKFPQYMVPSIFVPLEKFPLTPNGKLDRRALPLPNQFQLAAETEFVAASNEIEEQLTSIWQELLHVSSIGIHDDFFALGGHSLMAIRLMAQIKTTFGVDLPLAALFQKSNIASLAKIIETETIENKYISLVPIQPQGNRTPFFCIHGIGGHVMRFQKLAHHLGLDQPLYGVQAQGVDGNSEPYESIEAMAAHYIREIQIIQPHGPYLLGGLSMGGWIIYEMARQLQAQGQDVGLVAVFDTRADKLLRFFEDFSGFQMWQYLSRRYVSRLRYHYAKLLSLSWSAKVRYPLNFVSQKFSKDTHEQQNPVMNIPIPEELRAVWQANILAIRSYIPISYPGKLTLFRSTEVGEGSYYGWEEWAQGGVDVLDIPGTHIGILDEPNVQILAKKLTTCIDKVLKTRESLVPLHPTIVLEKTNRAGQ